MDNNVISLIAQSTALFILLVIDLIIFQYDKVTLDGTILFLEEEETPVISFSDEQHQNKLLNPCSELSEPANKKECGYWLHLKSVEKGKVKVFLIKLDWKLFKALRDFSDLGPLSKIRTEICCKKFLMHSQIEANGIDSLEVLDEKTVFN